jgi:chemotaxis protein methyltransferase CheR
MTLQFSPMTKDEFLLLRDYLEELCGISLLEKRAYLVEGRLRKIAISMGCSNFGSFYQKLKKGVSFTIRDQIIDVITTHETSWFRDAVMWEMLEQEIFPLFCKKSREIGQKHFRFWSAACSTGQEPYTLSMVHNHFCNSQPHRCVNCTREILATDISPHMIKFAKDGRYNNLAMERGLTDFWKNKYFETDGQEWRVTDKIRNKIVFFPFNLQDSFAKWGKFDLILMRNVLIYFSEQLKQEIVSKMINALVPNGVIIVGGSESILNSSDKLEMLKFKHGICYQRKVVTNETHKSVNL